MEPLFKRILRGLRDSVCRALVHGRVFRWYAPQAPPDAMGQPHSVALCNLIGNLGDQVMMFPLLDALQEQNPDLRITCFTDAVGKFLAFHPAVTELCIVPRAARATRSLYPANQVFSHIRTWKNLLRHKRFHTVAVLRGGVEPFGSHHFAWLLGGQTRVDYATSLEPERPSFQFHVSSLFTDEVVEMHGTHEVERGAEVLGLAGLLSRPVDIRKPVASLLALAAMQEGTAFRTRYDLSNRPYAIVSPGASMPRKSWPAARFAAVVRGVFLARGWLPVLVGGPDVSPVAHAIVQELNGHALDLTGKTDFAQLVAVSAGAQGFVGNDSGTGHVAGALGVPTVIISAYASSNSRTKHASPWRSHPVGPAVAVVQPRTQREPCTLECTSEEVHCIASVSEQEVQLALEMLLGSETPGGAADQIEARRQSTF